MLLLVVVLPKILALLAYALACRATAGILRRATAAAYAAIRRLDRLSRALRALILLLYGLDLWAGLLLVIRAHLGDFILLDELLVLSLPLGMMLVTWACYYDVQRELDRRRLRPSMACFTGTPEAGSPTLTRWQFVLDQCRHQLGLMLVPLLLLLAWEETLTMHGEAMSLHDPPWLAMAVRLAGAACIFLLAPLMVRFLWATQPVPDGPVRQMLLDVCRAHRVGVRNILEWRTHGTMINAAVMGIVAPLRYVLLTDAMLARLPMLQIEAVMAHEIGHVRRHHFFWLLVTALVTWMVLYLMSSLAIDWGITVGAMLLGIDSGTQAGLAEVTSAPGVRGPVVVAIAATILSGAAWVVLFGWVSRRIERQADTFAVQHLSRRLADSRSDDEPSPRLVHPAAVEAMTLALEQVAALNHIPPHRPSWRHGAIAWRQAHLRTLIGLDARTLPVDRTMLRIKLAMTAGTMMLVLLGWLVQAP